MPWLLERIDYTWERHRHYTGCNPDVRPSDLFREHIFGCFISDDTGIEVRHRIGVDNIMFESDYPHSRQQLAVQPGRPREDARQRPRRRGPQDRRGQHPAGLQLPSQLSLPSARRDAPAPPPTSRTVAQPSFFDRKASTRSVNSDDDYKVLWASRSNSRAVRRSMLAAASMAIFASPTASRGRPARCRAKACTRSANSDAG